MIVLRFNPVSRSVLRIEQPSSKHFKRLHCCVGSRHKGVSREFSVRLGKSVFAGSAFPALNAPFAEGASFHADRVLAS
jgi:hypothetical protein